jgi:lipopolysaccharide export system protein LptA
MKRTLFVLSALALLIQISSLTLFGEDEMGDTLKFVSDMPLKITANEVVAATLPEGRKVIYDGDVKATQGDLTMTCNHLELYWKETGRPGTPASGPGSLNMGDLASLHSITATGDVKFVQGDRMAVSGEALYDHKKGTITLRKGSSAGSKPMLWYDKDYTIAEVIVVYINENRVEFSTASNSPNGVKPKADPQDSRILTVITPKKRK